MTIQICKLCGSKWDDTKGKVCYQCGGDDFDFLGDSKEIFDTIDQIDVAIEAKQVEYEGMGHLIELQRDKVFEATDLLRQLESEEHELMGVYYELTNRSHNIKQQKKFIADEAKELEEKEIPIPIK